MAKKKAKIPIGYCGQKEREHDHLCGTGLVWIAEEGTVHEVSREAAEKLLRFPGVYFDARPEFEQEEDPLEPAAKVNKAITEADMPVEALDLPRNFESMEKPQLMELSLRFFNSPLDENETVDSMRAAIRQNVDRMRFDEMNPSVS